MKRVKDFLRQVIENYLEKQLDDISPDISVEDIIEEIDTDGLAKELSKKIEERVLKFEATPALFALHASPHYQCPSCYRVFGQWRGGNGMPLDMSLINVKGKRIVIIDDF